MHLAIHAAGDEATGSAVLREVIAKVNRNLTWDLARGGINQYCGEGLGRGVNAEEHARSFSSPGIFPSQNRRPKPPAPKAADRHNLK
jgi:hypothetical protein